MPLLVTTPLQIFFIDENIGRVSILRSGDGYYFGITHKKDVIILSHSSGYLQFCKMNAKPHLTSRHLYQPHQIEWVEDKILVTNTGKNCISIFDERGILCQDVFLNEIRWDDKNVNREGNHFNSVHKYSNKVYVVAHNYEKPSEVWQLSWPDLMVENVQACPAGWAHNIWVSDFGKVICNSRDNSLYNILTNETIWRSNEAGTLTRGLAVSDKNIFVGYSSFSERHDRFWKSGGIWVIDKNTLKTIEQISIPGSGDINEIRIVDELDDAHNGEILHSNSLEALKSTSPMINLAYNFRKRYSYFRQDLFLVSPFVRFLNMIPRWKHRVMYKREL
jgi:hypothetical protein